MRRFPVAAALVLSCLAAPASAQRLHLLCTLAFGEPLLKEHSVLVDEVDGTVDGHPARITDAAFTWRFISVGRELVSSINRRTGAITVSASDARVVASGRCSHISGREL